MSIIKHIYFTYKTNTHEWCLYTIVWKIKITQFFEKIDKIIKVQVHV